MQCSGKNKAHRGTRWGGCSCSFLCGSLATLVHQEYPRFFFSLLSTLTFSVFILLRLVGNGKRFGYTLQTSFRGQKKKKEHMLGIYMQRSWIVLILCCFLLLPTYILTTPILKYLGQPEDVAKLSGFVALWMLPVHFSYAFLFPLQTILQSRIKNKVISCTYAVGLVLNIFTSWYLFMF